MRRVIAQVVAAAAVVILMLGAVPASAETAGNEVTGACVYTLPRELDASRMTDADVMTRVTIDRNETLSVKLPVSDVPLTVYLEWYSLSGDKYHLYVSDASGAALLSEERTVSAYAETLTLEPGAAALAITSQAKHTLCTLRVFENGLPDTLAYGQPPDSCDLMLICATPYAAIEDFAGLLPLYAGEHAVSTAVTVLQNDRRYAMRETENALWTLGLSNSPVYLRFPYKENNDLKAVTKDWTAYQAQSKLVRTIRTLKPKVVVVCGKDASDARQSAAYQLTLDAVAQAAEAGGKQDPHTVQKLYVLDSSGETVVSYAEPTYRYDGRSAGQAVRDAYPCLAHQMLFHRTLPDEGRFTLYASTVGEDVAKNDLLENIDLSSLSGYLAATPTPEPTATPTPSPTPTATPTPTSAATSAPAPQEDATPFPVWAVIAAAGGAVLSVGLYFILKHTAARLPRAARIPLCLLPLACGIAVCIVLTASPGKAGAPQPTAAPTAEPTPTPTSTPTASPTPTAEPTPTPTPEPTAELPFALEETVAVDPEARTWVYRSPYLAVEARRVDAVYPDGTRTRPVVYYVAHIYMREYDSFRPAFASERHSGYDVCQPDVMAERYNAVLWITGDNLIHSEKERKGILIRDNRIFSENTAADSMVVGNDMTIKIVARREIKARDLWESGVENAYSFGPTLLQNGELTQTADRLGRQRNPRCGLGMVEPGHLVAIVADGRQPDYSTGLNLTDFAELFLNEGCTVAYNLDGGVSAAMLFLGVRLNQHADDWISHKENLSWQRSVPEGLVWGYSELDYPG